jgi:rhamnosyltransferase
VGAAGAVKTGLEYALNNDFDWLWVLDADSRPRSDALEKLVRLHESLDEATRMVVGVLSSCHRLVPSNNIFYGRRLSPIGSIPPKMNPSKDHHECDSVLWSGSLNRLDAVRRVGMPMGGKEGIWEDLAQDYGDIEFHFRLRQAGYKVIVHQRSVIEQPVGAARSLRIFGREILTTNHSPLRRYLFFRGLAYFWVHVYPSRILAGPLLYVAFKLLSQSLGILIGETARPAKIRACLEGVFDGFRKNLSKRPY